MVVPGGPDFADSEMLNYVNVKLTECDTYLVHDELSR